MSATPTIINPKLGTRAAAPPPAVPAVKLVTIYAEQTTDAHGNIVYKALKVLAADGDVTLQEASRILGLGVRNLAYMCSVGIFKTAHKPGRGTNAAWRISRAEVLARRSPPAD